VLDDYSKDPFKLGMCTQKHDNRSQVQLLKQNFDIRTADDVITSCAGGNALSKPTVSITFDDGYQDNLDNALPILQEFKVPATLFVATGSMETTQMFWWDRVIFAVHQAEADTLDLTDFNIQGCNIPLPLSQHHKKQSLETLLGGLWATNYPTCMRAVQEIERQLSATVDRQWAPRMNPEQLQAFHNAGMEIGAHSISHHDMTLLEDTSLNRELVEPKAALEELLGESVSGFAYPAGRLSDCVLETTRKAGYKYAMSTVRGINQWPLSDQYVIERMVVGDNNLKDFKRCLSELAGKIL